MKAEATPSNPEGENRSVQLRRRHSYQKVLDGRKQPIRGLWQRNGRFIARLVVEDDHGRKQTRWKALEGAATIPQAQKALAKLLDQRDTHALPVMRQTPKLKDYTAEYFDFLAKAVDTKRATTVNKERGAMNRWLAHMGETRLDRITKAQINKLIADRQSEGLSGRTVNLDVIALRNVLKRAIDDGWLRYLPTENMRPLKWTTKTRSLVTLADIDKLTSLAFKPLFVKGNLAAQGEPGKSLKNAQQFADFVRFMAFSGTRLREALRMRWEDVHFDRKQLAVGTDGLTKNREARHVDFNSALETHLRGMETRRAPDSQWLFPSPQRGEQDIHARSFQESLLMLRQASGLHHFRFHDCRHFFISFCVMSGIDYMTIARWVGHKDGGVLIGKVYGHLSNEHAQRQALKVNFGPALAPPPARLA